MTPEGKVKEKVKRVLKQYGVYWHCPVQNGLGAPSLDFVCCFRGKYFAVEAKAEGKKPTERQQRTIKEIEAAGGIVFVVDGEASLGILDNWLGELDGNT